MKTITTESITNEAELDEALKDLQKKNPGKYVTYDVCLGKVWMYVHERKPQSINTHGAEHTYRRRGGFLKDGKVVKPSESFIAKYEFCPVLG